MPKTAKSLIAHLQRDRRFMGTCSVCQREFRLADAILFSIDDDAPEAALEAIGQLRSQIKERKEQIARDRLRMTEGAKITATAVNLGKIVEKIVPSFASFVHAPGDCRALFEPIDYLIFCGLSTKREVNSLVFADVKSGKSPLNAHQRDVKRAVESGALHFSAISS